MAEQEEKKVGKRSDVLIDAYANRLSNLKHAHKHLKANEHTQAVEQFSQYLNSIASFHFIKETELNLSYFNLETDTAELLLISNAYWELAKAYDRSPKLGSESIRCLRQFALFTINLKFQYVNAQMVKKFIRHSRPHNPKVFHETYEKVRLQDKGCFIATYAFGEFHPITDSFREWRDQIQKNNMGTIFIKFYYKYSPRCVSLLSYFPPIGNLIKYLLIRPFLKTLALIIKIQGRKK